MENLEFSSLSELYNHLKPALKTKKKELDLAGFSYVYEEDIWNFMFESKWSSQKELTLYDLVDDIMNVNNYHLESYVKNLLKNNKRELNIEENDIL